MAPRRPPAWAERRKRSVRKRWMQETFFCAYTLLGSNCKPPATRAHLVFCPYGTVLEFVTNITIFYAPYKLALHSPPNLETEESRNTMKNTWLRFAAAAAIAGGMLLAAQEVSSQPAQAAVQRQQRQHDGGARIARDLNLTQ